MKCLVLKAFIDKETEKPYNDGDTYENSDSKRVAFLEGEGFVKGPEKVEHAEVKEKVKKKEKA